jgi:hypothetical protein
MSFTALKGWNFHTDTFDTVQDFFNPLKNPNYTLSRTCTVSQLFTGIAKVFDRQFIREDKFWDVSGDIAQEFIDALIEDPRIHTIHLLGMTITNQERHDDEIDEYISDEDRLYVTLYTMYNADRSYQWTSRGIEIDFDDLSIAEAVNAVVALVNSSEFVNPNAFTALDHEYAVSPVEAPMNSSLLSTIWGHHFGKTHYKQYFSYEGVLTYTDRSVNLTTLIGEVREGHQFETTTDYNVVRWVVPALAGDRRMLHRLHSYSTKASQLIQGNLRSANELSDNLYGLELEVSSNLSIPNIVDAPEKTYCFVKQDSSITGSQRNNYEIVSVPATLKVHIKSWAEIFSKVGYTNFDSTKNTNNGLHIHIDMNAFNNNGGSPDQLHLKHFCWFFINPVHTAFQMEMSERDQASMDKYAKFPKFYHTTLPSCFKSTLDYTQHPFRGIVHFKQDANTGRFVTLEVRMFKGIVSLGSIVKNLEYVDSVFDFTRKTCFQSNTLGHYLEYLSSTPSNRYTTLKEYLNRIGQEEIRQTATMLQLLYGQTDPDKVLSILRKANVHITKENVDTLNTLIPGVKFGLKHGHIVVVETNRSRLYDLDMSLQQRFTKFKGNKKHVSHPHP